MWPKEGSSSQVEGYSPRGCFVGVARWGGVVGEQRFLKWLCEQEKEGEEEGV